MPPVRLHACFHALLGLLLSGSLAAGQVLTVSSGHQGGRYSLDMTVYIDADAAAVHRIATDYEELERVSETIVDSRLISAPGEPSRREMEMRTCILFFCFDAILARLSQLKG